MVYTVGIQHDILGKAKVWKQTNKKSSQVAKNPWRKGMKEKNIEI